MNFFELAQQNKFKIGNYISYNNHIFKVCELEGFIAFENEDTDILFIPPEVWMNGWELYKDKKDTFPLTPHEAIVEMVVNGKIVASNETNQEQCIMYRYDPKEGFLSRCHSTNVFVKTTMGDWFFDYKFKFIL